MSPVAQLLPLRMCLLPGKEKGVFSIFTPLTLAHGAEHHGSGSSCTWRTVYGEMMSEVLWVGRERWQGAVLIEM